MKQLFGIAFLCMFTTAVVAEDCRLQGGWKSDAARTLAGINSARLRDPETLNAISDDLFGHMIHEWTCTEYRERFDTQSESIAVAYETVAESEYSITVRVLSDPAYVLSVVWEGECYKLPVAGHDFYE
ncbi:MAG: hypothetical protein RIA65_12770 [Woeseia sp.]